MSWTEAATVSKNGRWAGQSYVTRRYKKRGVKRPALDREPKNLFIRRAAKTPNPDCPLSHTVLVVEPGKRSCKVHFHEQNFLLLTGNLMPMGVSHFKPAYIKIIWRVVEQRYDVLCCYLDRTAEVLLWTSESLPKWAEPIYPPRG